MAKQVFKLDVECREDGRSNRIRVPIGGDRSVRRLLEIVRERSNMSLTTLYTLRDGHKALLDPDDTLHLVLDAGENRLRAEATPAKASAPPPLRSRSRSPARRKRSEKARLHRTAWPPAQFLGCSVAEWNSQRSWVIALIDAWPSNQSAQVAKEGRSPHLMLFSLSLSLALFVSVCKLFYLVDEDDVIAANDVFRPCKPVWPAPCKVSKV